MEHNSFESDSTKKYTFLDLGTSYVNNNNQAGQFSNLEVQPAWSAMASLTTKSGFDLSLNYYLIQNSDSSFSKPTSSANLDLGYSFDFLKNFSLRFALNHTFQPTNTGALTKGYDNSLYANLGYNYDWITGGLGSTYMLGNRIPNKSRLNSLSFSWSNNLSLDIDNFIKEDNSLSFQPGFSLGVSDQKLYNDYLLTALTSGEGGKIIAKLMKKRPKLTLAQAITILKAKIVKGQKLQATSFGLNMPIVYSLGDYTITLTPSAYKPLNQPAELVDTSWKFTLELSVIYAFTW